MLMDCQYGSGLFERKAFLYKGLAYSYATNDFQAEKVPEEDRQRVEDVDPTRTATMSREYDINVETWDKGRASVMEDIVMEQAIQHDDMKKFLVKHCDREIAASGVSGSAFWSKTIKKIYSRVVCALIDEQE